MKSRALLTTLIIITLSTLSAMSFSESAETGTKPLGFIIFGDAGTGTEAQYRTSKAMEQVCNVNPCAMAFGLGDNIYERGPSSVRDSQFVEKFEKPFAKLNFPFYMVLGNHDTTSIIPGDGGANSRGKIEVNYTQHSDKWRMPARYYALRDAHASSLFIGYDSNQANAYLISFWNPYWWPKGRYTQKQSAWINKTLKNNDNKNLYWKFAFAHHPLITNGHHHQDPSIQGKGPYKEFMQKTLCSKVDFVFAGHEHAQEILLADEANCGKTKLVLTGSAAKSNGKIKNEQFEKEWDDYNGNLGFMHGYINGQYFTLTAYKVDANSNPIKLYSQTYVKEL